MKQKLRAALVAAAIAAAITGSAVAAGSNLDVLQAFFRGDTSSAQEYVNSTAYSVSSEGYRLTVNSSVSDEDTAYAVVTVTALSAQAKQGFAEKTMNLEMDILYEEDGAENSFGGVSFNFVSMRELKDARTEDSRSFTLSSTLMGTAYAVRPGLWPGEPGEGERLELEVPLTPAPSVTVALGVSGTGIPNYNADLSASGALTLEEVTLTPFACVIHQAETDAWENGYRPRLLFRMADGSIRTQSQMMNYDHGVRTSCTYRFYEVQELENIRSVIAFDMEYPLDGSAPAALAHDPALDPISLPRAEPLKEGGNFAVPVRALTEGLDGVCTWDPATGDASCTYRGVTVVIHPGSDTATVNGAPVTTLPPQVQAGSMVADSTLFFDAWGLDGYVMWLDSDENGNVVRGDWLIIP